MSILSWRDFDFIEGTSPLEFSDERMNRFPETLFIYISVPPPPISTCQERGLIDFEDAFRSVRKRPLIALSKRLHGEGWFSARQEVTML